MDLSMIPRIEVAFGPKVVVMADAQMACDMARARAHQGEITAVVRRMEPA